MKGRVWMAFSCQSHHQELFLSFSPHSDIFDGKIKNCPSGSESFNHSYFAFHRDWQDRQDRGEGLLGFDIFFWDLLMIGGEVIG